MGKAGMKLSGKTMRLALLVAAVRMSEMAFWVVWVAERKAGEAWQAATRSLVDILSIAVSLAF